MMRIAAERANRRRADEVANASGQWAIVSGVLIILLRLIPVKILTLIFGIIFSCSFALMVFTFACYQLMIRYTNRD